MTRSLFLMLLISFSSWAFAQEVVDALRLRDFDCIQRQTQGCSYQECEGKIPGYTRSVLVLIPEIVTSTRLHFHGHKLNIFPQYDKNLKSMVKAFELEAPICQSSELVVFPESRGKCTDYESELKDEETIKTFLTGLQVSLGPSAKSLPLHLSAHSGGGKVLGRMLSLGFKVNEVSVFDGVYSSETRTQIKEWHQRHPSRLTMVTVKGASPESHASILKKELEVTEKAEIIKLGNDNYRRQRKLGLLFLSRDAEKDEELKAHYETVTQAWRAE